MPHKLIYTSAPQGLAANKSGFCTVGKDAAMPANLERELEALSGYRHHEEPGDSRNPVAYTHLKARVSGKLFHVLSRICDAGLDHTSRSNKLACHLALSAAELPAGGPAWLLGQPGIVPLKWDGNCDGDLSVAIPAGGSDSPKCEGWKQKTGDAGWGGVLAQAIADNQKQPVWVIYEPGFDLLPLFRQSLALLPESLRWKVTFNTYFTKLPPGMECRWRGAVAGSESAKLAKRSSLVIDLTSALGSLDAAYSGTMIEAARSGRIGHVEQAPPSGARRVQREQPTESAPVGESVDRPPATPPRAAQPPERTGPAGPPTRDGGPPQRGPTVKPAGGRRPRSGAPAPVSDFEEEQISSTFVPRPKDRSWERAGIFLAGLVAGILLMVLVMFVTERGPMAPVAQNDEAERQDIPRSPSKVENSEDETKKPKDEPKAKPKDEPKAKPKDEPKAKPKDEPKAKPKDEPKAKPKDEPKAKPKDEPKKTGPALPSSPTSKDEKNDSSSDTSAEGADKPTFAQSFLDKLKAQIAPNGSKAFFTLSVKQKEPAEYTITWEGPKKNWPEAIEDGNKIADYLKDHLKIEVYPVLKNASKSPAQRKTEHVEWKLKNLCTLSWTDISTDLEHNTCGGTLKIAWKKQSRPKDKQLFETCFLLFTFGDSPSLGIPLTEAVANPFEPISPWVGKINMKKFANKVSANWAQPNVPASFYSKQIKLSAFTDWLKEDYLPRLEINVQETAFFFPSGDWGEAPYSPPPPDSYAPIKEDNKTQTLKTTKAAEPKPLNLQVEAKAEAEEHYQYEQQYNLEIRNKRKHAPPTIIADLFFDLRFTKNSEIKIEMKNAAIHLKRPIPKYDDTSDDKAGKWREARDFYHIETFYDDEDHQAKIVSLNKHLKIFLKESRIKKAPNSYWKGEKPIDWDTFKDLYTKMMSGGRMGNWEAPLNFFKHLKATSAQSGKVLWVLPSVGDINWRNDKKKGAYVLDFNTNRDWAAREVFGAKSRRVPKEGEKWFADENSFKGMDRRMQEYHQAIKRLYPKIQAPFQEPQSPIQYVVFYEVTLPGEDEPRRVYLPPDGFPEEFK